ncbi:MAG: biopolymer transporter ExbD [Myxococcales bacterium]|nr:biopolymer transporter ExbD [Myxococcales bacterium]MCB9580048.1 biopolymer transporter ExbD [Polyangiaceae bacterium]
MRLSIPVLVGVALVAFGCDDKPQKNPFDPPPKETKEPPPITEVPKPKGPPELAIDDMGPKVGFTRILLDKPEGKSKLEKELQDNKAAYDGKEATLSIVRKAKMSWVVTMVQELADIGATKILIKTDTREEYPKELPFTPQRSVPEAAPCSVVGMVLDDRGTAIWKLSGGTASKRAKGFAGPDLTMTGETIERYAKACKQSSIFFVSAADGIEWGLAYDLAASTQKLEGKPLTSIVLLTETPTAGRPVKLQ